MQLIQLWGRLRDSETSPCGVPQENSPWHDKFTRLQAAIGGKSLLPVPGALVGPRWALRLNSHSQRCGCGQVGLMLCHFHCHPPTDHWCSESAGWARIARKQPPSFSLMGWPLYEKVSKEAGLHSRWKAAKLCTTARDLVSARCKLDPA